MGSLLSPVMVDTKYFEAMISRTTPLKPNKWLRFVDDIFILLLQDVQVLLGHKTFSIIQKWKRMINCLPCLSHTVLVQI